jgi:site-specific DNA recombinase
VLLVAQPGSGLMARRAVDAALDPVSAGPKRAVEYRRVSKERENMISPELQGRAIADFLSRNSDLVLAGMVEDLDASGRNFIRAGIQEIIARVEAGTCDVVLVYRYDRFGRNVRHSLVNIAKVERAGGRVISVTEPIDADTAYGKFSRVQLLALAELQSDLISENWMTVKSYRIARGLPFDGRDRYGYIAHRQTAGTRRCPEGCEPGACETGYVPDPASAEVVTRCYAAFLAGQGMNAIADMLNREAVPPPGFWHAQRSRSAKKISAAATYRWKTSTVVDLLDSGFAAGLIWSDKQCHPGAHDALITPEQWRDYQAKRASRRAIPAKARAPKHLLAGIAVCGVCGSNLHCSTTNRGYMYQLRCSAYQTSGPSTCPGVWLVRHAAEAAVVTWLQKYASHIDEKAHQVAPPPETAHSPGKTERRNLEQRAGQIQQMRSRLTDAYLAGVLTLEELQAKRNALDADEAQVAEQIAKEPQREPQPEPAVVRPLLEIWDGLSIAARRDVISALIHRVRVHQDKSIEVVPRWETTAPTAPSSSA